MFRFFTSDLRKNIIKVLCLTLGIAFGFLLVAKVYFEISYDDFFPDSHNLYRITESVVRNGNYSEGFNVPGAVAPGMKEYIPQVESSTRCTGIIGQTSVIVNDGREFEVESVVLADSCHFDVLVRDIIVGDPHEVLAVENSCMIPKSLADKIGGDVVDTELIIPAYSSDYRLNIGGVYDDYPDNSTIPNAVYISLSTIRHFTGDGRENWVGNDRYASHLRLTKGTTPEDIQPYIDRMVEENVDKDTREMVNLTFHIKPIVDIHSSDKDQRSMTWVLALLATVMLMSASLNYLLIVIGQIGQRSKEMAVRKCYGTSNLAIFSRIMGEGLFFILVSVVLALLIVFSFSDECRQILGYSPEVLFSTKGVWYVEIAVCVVLLIIAGVIPGWIYCHTPVTQAFNRFYGGRKFWKLALLSVQFFASGLLFCLLVLIGRQYILMTNVNLGYNPSDLALVRLDGIPNNTRLKIMEELGRLAGVKGIASADQDFVNGSSGNNVWIDGQEENSFNAADMYFADNNIADVMGLRMVEGEIFDDIVADSAVAQVIVDERFVESFKKNFNVSDNLVGRRFFITEHGEATITGIIAPVRRGGFGNSGGDRRPTVIFSAGADNVRPNLYVRFHDLTPEILNESQQLINQVAPEYKPIIFPYKMSVSNLYAPVRKFGTSVLIVGLAIVITTLIGLMGYTTDEVQRRAREIAIRKVNGTSAGQILRLFCTDILRVAVPSLILGGLAAMVIGHEWLSHFTEQVGLSPLATVVTLLLLTAVITSVIVITSQRIARSNPVDYLRSE